MPLYDYKCSRCGREVRDVVAKYDDPPPVTDEPCGAVPEGSTTQFPCTLERMACSGSWRWKGDYNNEGRGGWTRQGDFMSRKVDRKPVRMTPTTRRR